MATPVYCCAAAAAVAGARPVFARRDEARPGDVWRRRRARKDDRYFGPNYPKKEKKEKVKCNLSAEASDARWKRFVHGVFLLSRPPAPTTTSRVPAAF